MTNNNLNAEERMRWVASQFATRLSREFDLPEIATAAVKVAPDKMSNRVCGKISVGVVPTGQAAVIIRNLTVVIKISECDPCELKNSDRTLVYYAEVYYHYDHHNRGGSNGKSSQFTIAVERDLHTSFSNQSDSFDVASMSYIGHSRDSVDSAIRTAARNAESAKHEGDVEYKE